MGRSIEDDLPLPDLADLFREHAAGLAGAVRGILGPRADVPEVVQEAFLKAWRARAEGARPRDTVAWVFVLTLNLSRDLRRRAQRRGNEKDLAEDIAVELSTKEPLPPESMESRETLAAAREAILRLKEPEKEVFLLRVSGDRTFESVAEALGIPVGTAKSRMRAALHELRRHLKAFAPEPGAAFEIEGEAR